MKRIVNVLAVLVAGGCSLAGPPVHSDTRTEWRKGQVFEISSSSEFASRAGASCPTSKEGKAATRFARIAMYAPRNPTAWRTVPLFADREIRAGQDVYVHRDDCRVVTDLPP